MIGGLVAAALVAVGVFYVVKRRRTQGSGMAISNPAFEQGKGGEQAGGDAGWLGGCPSGLAVCVPAPARLQRSASVCMLQRQGPLS